MILYDKFLKALEGSFEEFIKSDDVNSFLQSVSGEVSKEVVQDGVVHRFIVVSGYEEDRGHWATAYAKSIRFDAEVISVIGIKRPMVLTPNFFYGKNSEDEEVEYRIGIIKDHSSVHLFPVVLKKSKD